MIKKAVIFSGIILILLALAGGWFIHRVRKPVIDLHGRKYVYIHIPTGSGFGTVLDTLRGRGLLTDPDAFTWLAHRKHYDEKVRPGRYRLTDRMRNNALVNLLRSGMQEPVEVIIRNPATGEELAGRVGRKIEADSTRLSALFNDRSYLRSFGLTPATVLALFIPNTYQFYWNTSAGEFMDRMKKEYDRFWTAERRNRAATLNLSIAEVVTLASIVEKESNRNDEKPLIAGVYLNRLRINMPLQADPTIVFAWNDRRIKRVYKSHTEIDSPYNTYRLTGLPPGPICLPSVSSVDAVLHARHHSYLYFCAREDFSGYHNFAADPERHRQNARRYQQALNKLNIR
ncbi:MAG TPA: endolytic transglycosylase MltG [Bacteroidales bacterium]|nr:endolytic transglycosylase MltG [Bacteroidales bacterium]HPS62150.1 endolytic transglycosylase MltG [Bacteroidales bacterium]